VIQKEFFYLSEKASFLNDGTDFALISLNISMRIANRHGGVKLSRLGCWSGSDCKQAVFRISCCLNSSGHHNEL